MNQRLWLSLIALLTALALGFGVPASDAMTCLDALSERPDLSQWIPNEQIEGRLISSRKWLLGEGSEAMIFRHSTQTGFKVRKVYPDVYFAQLSMDSIRELQRLNQNGFKVISGGRRTSNVIELPWIRGVALDKVLESGAVPQEIKAELYATYKVKLTRLVQDLLMNHPEFDLDISSEGDLMEVAQTIEKSDALRFIELKVPAHLIKPTLVKRFMMNFYPKGISGFEKEDFRPLVLEPKTDNIIVDPKTWELTWIDPN